MRWTSAAVAGVALAAALLVTGCAAGAAQPGTVAQPSATASPASTQGCYVYAVSALRRHIVVRRRPAACAGLGQEQVNQVVARAIRTVVGPHHKAVERRLAAAYSRYLASLVRPVRPPPAAATTTGPAITPGGLPARLAALAAWLAAAAAGAYLLAGWLTRDGRRRRIIRTAGVPPSVPLAHAGLAIAGLGIWIAFTVTTAAFLAWIDVGLTWAIAGLGMATLLAASPEQRVRTGTDGTASGDGAGTGMNPFPARAPVITIALHGILATVTILLVLLAAIATG
jgi:manganese efflux pump family protein